ATGGFATLPASPPAVFALSRTGADGAAVMVANLSDATVDATVTGLVGYRPVYGPAPDGNTVTLGPYEIAWLQR
ncbi:MAG: alpha-glucosidase C-terminal domain-containing protein, partial [Actinomycetota bacterium]|nr:alpha-glucosidase C-terminal domain-containing protein [Actinomycetota bacterium]